LLKIAICDDNKSHRKEIKDIVSRVLFDRDELFIDLFADGEDIVTLIDSGVFSFDLVFLDIEMPVVDGLKTADIIRTSNIATDIIFLTAHGEYVYEGYKFRAFSYLTKPVSASKIAKELNRYMDWRDNSDAKFLIISYNGTKQRINIDRIDYIESDRRKVNVISGTENFGFYAKLDDIERQLKRTLKRVHQSYMVNMNKIVKLGKNEMTVENGAVIPISKRYYSEVKTAYETLCSGDGK
jgi:DNA-binding LytR/AlgR family response regulator